MISAYSAFRQRTLSALKFSILLGLLALVELFDQCSLHFFDNRYLFKKIVICLESLLPFALLFYSLTYARQNRKGDISLFWKAMLISSIVFPVYLAVLSPDALFFSPDFPYEKVLFLNKTGYWFYIGLMIYHVFALINIEATLAATSGQDRWRIKFEVTGIIGIIAALIFYYSQGLLYRSINMDLLPFRSGVLIIGALLIGFSKVVRGGNTQVKVSRFVIYRSVSLMVIGIYLLSLGLIAGTMNYFDISFGASLTVFLAIVSGMLVLLILFSEKLRRRSKVFISKHFYEHKHDYKEEWLRFTGKISLCKTLDDLQETILKTFEEIFVLDRSSLYVFDKVRGTYVFAAGHSMPGALKEFRASEDLIRYFAGQNRVLNLSDKEYRMTEEEALFANSAGASVVVPMIYNMKVEGLVVFGRQLTGEDYIFEDYDLMKTLARQSALSLMNFKFLEEIIATREMAALARISSFIIHDLKNLTYTLSLTLENAREHIRNPEFQDDMIITIQNTLNKMNTLIHKLKTIPDKTSLKKEIADIHILARETVDELAKTRPAGRISCVGSPAFSIVDKDEVKKVILNLLINALDSAGADGKVIIETGLDNEESFIRVRDNGPGIDREFMQDNLFKPFRTTKEKGLGIGLYQCKQIIEAHGGRIEAESEPRKETVFTVRLPAFKEM